MPYHIKKGSVLGSAVPTDGQEYYAGDNHWTNDYNQRKIYENKSDAEVAAKTVETLWGAYKSVDLNKSVILNEKENEKENEK